jgi:hypothetical protein
MNLFTHLDLWAWLNAPFETPPLPYEMQQLSLAWGKLEPQKREPDLRK